MRKAHCALSAGWAGVGAVCLLLAAGGAWGGGTIALGNASATAGQLVSVPVSYAPAGAAVEPSTLVLKAAWDAGWVQFAGVSAGPGLATAGKTFDFEPNGKSVTVVVYGGQNALPPGEFIRLDFQVSASAMAGTAAVVRHGGGSNASDAGGTPVPITVTDGGLTVTVGPKPHSADFNGNWSLSLSELLRVVQFYNIGAFHCDTATEDGYAPFSGGQSCTPHDVDYAPRDWSVSLNELLRMIQFYNAPGGVYHYESGTEDNYAPGVWVPTK